MPEAEVNESKRILPEILVEEMFLAEEKKLFNGDLHIKYCRILPEVGEPDTLYFLITSEEKEVIIDIPKVDIAEEATKEPESSSNTNRVPALYIMVYFDGWYGFSASFSTLGKISADYFNTVKHDAFIYYNSAHYAMYGSNVDSVQLEYEAAKVLGDNRAHEIVEAYEKKYGKYTGPNY